MVVILKVHSDYEEKKETKLFKKILKRVDSDNKMQTIELCTLNPKMIRKLQMLFCFCTSLVFTAQSNNLQFVFSTNT